ncbi:MAG: hypothetical protein ABI461_22170, partial [Polyangiaceae bacterium]
MNRSFFALVALSVVAAACSPAAPAPVATAPHTTASPPLASNETAPAARADGRLATTVTPLHYDLKFDVDPAQGGFRGITTISVHAAAPTSFVVLNGREMRPTKIVADINKVAVTGTWTTRRA